MLISVNLQEQIMVQKKKTIVKKNGKKVEIVVSAGCKVNDEYRPRNIRKGDPHPLSRDYRHREERERHRPPTTQRILGKKKEKK